MIDPVLKKFGMFEASRSIHNLNDNHSFILRTPNKHLREKKSVVNSQNYHHRFALNEKSIEKIRNKQYIHNNSYNKGKSSYLQNLKKSNNTSNRKTKRQSEETKLDSLIGFLESNYCCVCPNHSNNNNMNNFGSERVKFVCLEQSCSQNFGCAECFLYKHNDHEKAEIGTCLRDLQHLETLMRESFEFILSQKTVIKEQFMSRIEIQFEHMKEQVEQNICFLRNKAEKEIDEHLFAKYEQFDILYELRNQSSKLQTDSELLSELLKIDIKKIEKDLSSQIAQLNSEKIIYQPIVELFEEMNGSLGHFLAESKKSFPKINSQNRKKSEIQNKTNEKDKNEKQVKEFRVDCQGQNEKKILSSVSKEQKPQIKI